MLSYQVKFRFQTSRHVELVLRVQKNHQFCSGTPLKSASRCSPRCGHRGGIAMQNTTWVTGSHNTRGSVQRSTHNDNTHSQRQYPDITTMASYSHSYHNTWKQHETKQKYLTKQGIFIRLTYNLAEAGVGVILLHFVPHLLRVEEEGTHCSLWLVRIL